MQRHIHRRASLGLAIQGPFSRNHRRRPLREWTYPAIGLSLAILLAAFGFFLFR